MKKLRIWLDDERPMPDDFDEHLKVAELVIEMIKTGTVEFISLDNDLGIGRKEGRTVAEFIEKAYISGDIDFVDFHPHTQNPVAFDAIMACKRAVYKHKLNKKI